MTTIVALDDLTLSLIFARLSIQDAWTSGRACARLNVARRSCAEVKRELALMIGKDAKLHVEKSMLAISEKYKLVDVNGDAMFPRDDPNSQMQIYSFPLDFARLLFSNFNNLSTLTISSRGSSSELDSIIHLLEKFNQPNGTSQLSTLKLYSKCAQTNNDDDDPSTTKRLIPNIRTHLRLLSAVNSIGSLRKLTLDVNNSKFCKSLKHSRIDLPILAQLELFEFNSGDEFVCLYDSITRYAAGNEALRSIVTNFQTEDFAWFLALPTELASRFTHLRVLLHFYNFSRFENLCRHFAHLTSLEISHNKEAEFTIYQLFRSLTHLPNLLSLVVNTNAFNILHSTIEGQRGRALPIPELPSVKVFTISITRWSGTTRCHQFFHYLNMNHMLPNVQVIRVIRDDAICGKCRRKLAYTAGTEEVVVRFEEHCSRHVFRHFAHSQHLRMVSSKAVGIFGFRIVGIRYRQWTWNEMEPFELEEDELIGPFD